MKQKRSIFSVYKSINFSGAVWIHFLADNINEDTIKDGIPFKRGSVSFLFIHILEKYSLTNPIFACCFTITSDPFKDIHIFILKNN